MKDLTKDIKLAMTLTKTYQEITGYLINIALAMRMTTVAMPIVF